MMKFPNVDKGSYLETWINPFDLNAKSEGLGTFVGIMLAIPRALSAALTGGYFERQIKKSADTNFYQKLQAVVYDQKEKDDYDRYLIQNIYDIADLSEGSKFIYGQGQILIVTKLASSSINNLKKHNSIEKISLGVINATIPQNEQNVFDVVSSLADESIGKAGLVKAGEPMTLIVRKNNEIYYLELEELRAP